MHSAIGIVIVNFNNATDTEECLKSIAESVVKPVVVIVDNNSQKRNGMDTKNPKLAFHFYHKMSNRFIMMKKNSSLPSFSAVNIKKHSIFIALKN